MPRYSLKVEVLALLLSSRGHAGQKVLCINSHVKLFLLRLLMKNLSYRAFHAKSLFIEIALMNV